MNFHSKRTKRAAKIAAPRYPVRIMDCASLAHPSGLIARDIHALLISCFLFFRFFF